MKRITSGWPTQELAKEPLADDCEHESLVQVDVLPAFNFSTIVDLFSIISGSAGSGEGIHPLHSPLSKRVLFAATFRCTMATHLHVGCHRPARQTDRGGYCLWQRRKSRDVSNLGNAPKRYNPSLSLVPLSLRSIRGRAPRPPMGGPHRMTRSGGVGFPPHLPCSGPRRVLVWFASISPFTPRCVPL
jgi:hypothetical protein